MRRIDAADVVGLVGLALLAAGLYLFDWRAALVGVGLVLVLWSTLAIFRA